MNKKPRLELPGLLFQILQDNAVIFQFLAVLFSRMMDGFKNFDVSLTELRQFCVNLDGGAPATLVQYITNEFLTLRASIKELPGDESEIRQAVKALWLVLMSMQGISPEQILYGQDAGCVGRKLDYQQAWRLHRILAHPTDPLTRTAKEAFVGNLPVLTLLEPLNMPTDELKRREMYSRVILPREAFLKTHQAYLDTIYQHPRLDEFMKVR